VLATKIEAHGDYSMENFRTLAAKRGRILVEEPLSATRSLFLLTF